MERRWRGSRLVILTRAARAPAFLIVGRSAHLSPTLKAPNIEMLDAAPICGVAGVW